MSEEGSYADIRLDLSKPLVAKTFSSSEEFRSFVKSTGGSSAMMYAARGGLLSKSMAVQESGVAIDAAVSTPGVSGASNTLEFSETNNQVAGVDEADLIKTDGEYIYTISNKALFIVKAYPGSDAEILSTTTLEHTPQALFLNDDELVVFSTSQQPFLSRAVSFPYSSSTLVHVYDVSDRQEPELLKEYSFEGAYFTARMIEDEVYLVLRNNFYDRPVFPTPLVKVDEVRSLDVQDIHYFPIRYRNPELVTVHSFSFDNLDDVDSLGVTVDHANSIYMSGENLFIISNQYVSEHEMEQEVIRELLEPELTQDAQDLIRKIKRTDNDILSQVEKENKIMQVYYGFLQTYTPEEQESFYDEVEEVLLDRIEKQKYFEYSIVHKVSVQDGLELSSSGRVPGTIVNQFSLDEHDDHLRIATTINRQWSRFSKTTTPSTNNVWVLNEDLDMVGELTGLAEDERIYSTRFIGDRLYMVTFRQIDPFFVIDLSDPQNPTELGELKIPGFSRYLHPFDDDHIIGIGQDATETGRTNGLKISLFDVSDVSDPQEVAQYVTEERYASSTALYEHKAFLFDKEKELLVIPAYNYDYKDESDSYNGAFVFHITDEEILIRGLVDHSQGSDRHYGVRVQRSLYIEDELFTKSPSLLRINDLDTLESVKDVELKHSSIDIPVY